jgi:diguanylate cyclase (GGDEF)-like protein/PAS domain S-box-containing protein
VGVSLLLASSLQGVISRPILRLGETMRSVSIDRNYGLRAEKESDDEIGRLMDGFNAMLSEIQTRDAALQTANVDLAVRQRELEALTETLELRVAERTAAAELRNQELARTWDALRESEERYALAVQGANDGLWDWNLKTGKLYLSPRWKSLLGHQPQEIGDSPKEWMKRIHPEDRERVQSEIEAHLEGRTPFFESEHQLRHKGGHYVWALVRGLAVLDESGKPMRMAGSQTDVTSGKVADLLTGLPNRVLFLDRMRRALDRLRRRPEYCVAVLFVDLDRFKFVNDSLGHAAGDEMLREVARRLESCMRPRDLLTRMGANHTVARLGGDEFTIFLDDIKDVTAATRVADRISGALADPFNIRGQEVFITASIGIAASGPGHETPEDLLRDADTAMYRAKLEGKARYEVFDAQMREQVMTRLQLETDLRRAIEHSELKVHYQPITALESGRTVGFEALVRWDHRVRGLIEPAHFIPLAEETGLIIPLGRWVLHEACRQMSEWQGRHQNLAPMTVAVNLSSKQLAQRDLVGEIMRVLADTSLDAKSLKLEITESMIMADPDAAIDMLAELKALHVQASIDDFGTGYSSLSYLHRFPVETVKVDRSFVSAMRSEDAEDGEIVRAIVSLAHNLGLAVIAEGVETSHQMRRLKSLGCEYAQGFLFSYPLSSEIATGYVAEQARLG